MIKLIGCLDKRLQGEQISSVSVVTELSHQFSPVVACPYCGKKWMQCVLKSSSMQNKEAIAGGRTTSAAVFPQYRFSCNSCSAKKYVLLTTDLEIDHSPFKMDWLFSMMLEKKVYHLPNRDLEKTYGMSKNTLMKWNRRFSHDYILLKTFLPSQNTDEEILSGRVPLSHAMILFFFEFGRFFLHPPDEFSAAVLPGSRIVYKTILPCKRLYTAISQ